MSIIIWMRIKISLNLFGIAYDEDVTLSSELERLLSILLIQEHQILFKKNIKKTTTKKNIFLTEEVLL